MPKLPIHKIEHISDYGVLVRKISSAQLKNAIRYIHRDDYYLFGLIIEGGCNLNVDFKDYPLSKGEVMFVRPGQAHCFGESNNFEAYVLIVDTAFVSNCNKRVFREYGLCSQRISFDDERQRELHDIIKILDERTQGYPTEQTKDILRNLATAFVGIVAETVRNACSTNTVGNDRHIELMLRFEDLLEENIRKCRNPAYYASLLNISPVYLNEIVNEVAGMSTSAYIRDEIILQAKRLLIYSRDSIKEIGYRLGMADSAYFTKTFIKATGMTPSAFRKRNLE